jgi:hypothetical protein
LTGGSFVPAGESAPAAIPALSRADRHVVNHVLEDRSVTVTYCNMTRYARVLTGPGVGPLEVVVGGYADALVI